MSANALDNFHLLDLPTQAEAVQALLEGRPYDDKVAWFVAHGELSALPRERSGRQIYLFRSYIGMECLFFIDGGDLVLVGDNTTWVVPRRR